MSYDELDQKFNGYIEYVCGILMGWGQKSTPTLLHGTRNL